MTIRIRIENDPDLENPTEWDGQWTVYSFGRRHLSYKDPEELGLSLERGEDGKPKVLNPGLRRKLEVGLAFFLSYYEHGGSVWSLIGEGPQCRWDTVSLAGLLVWEHPPKELGAKSREDRAKDARRFLETYNAWSNGDGMGYVVEDVVECDRHEQHYEHLDSCWGFYGNDRDHLFDSILAAIPEARRTEERIFAGDLQDGAERELEKAIEREKARKLEKVQQ
jgi:hypothetical protein